MVLENNGNDFDYTLLDEDGQEVDAIVKETGEKSYAIQSPRSGYIEGMRYTLSLGPNVTFSAPEIEDTNTLVFAIERKPIEQYEFTKEVVETQETIIEIDEETIEVTDFTGDAGDLIFGTNEEEKEVIYKITEMKEDGTFTVTTPALDEIYAELNVYGEYLLDFSEAIVNPALESQIIELVEQSDFFEDLKMAAYSDDANGNIQIGVEIVEDEEYEEESLNFTIKLAIQPNDEGLFGNQRFKDHEVTLVLNGRMLAQADIDIQDVVNWDIATIRHDAFQWSADVEILRTEGGDTSAVSQAISTSDEEVDEWEIYELIYQLRQITQDEAISTIPLFEYDLPIVGVPGLTIATEVDFSFQTALSTDADLESFYATASTVGLSFREGVYQPYSNLIAFTNEGGANFKGQFAQATSLEFAVKTSLFNDEIASIHLRPMIGLQTDGYSPTRFEKSTSAQTAITSQAKKTGFYKPILSFDAEIYSLFGTLTENFSFEEQIKSHQLVVDGLAVENETVASGIQISLEEGDAIDSLITPATFSLEMYNPHTDTSEWVLIDFDDLVFTLADGTELVKQSPYLILPDTEEEELTIHTYYKKDGIRFFDEAFVVNIPENKEATLTEHASFSQGVELYLDLAPGGNIPDYTMLSLNDDGFFTGEYLGMEGRQAEPTLVYQNEFSGQFTEIEKIDEYSYSLQLTTMNYTKEIGSEWADGHIPYQATTANGLDNGQSFILYAPGTPVEQIPQDTRNWSTTYWDLDPYNEPPKNLNCWLLRNTTTNRGFFSRDEY